MRSIVVRAAGYSRADSDRYIVLCEGTAGSVFTVVVDD